MNKNYKGYTIKNAGAGKLFVIWRDGLIVDASWTLKDAKRLIKDKLEKEERR